MTDAAQGLIQTLDAERDLQAALAVAVHGVKEHLASDACSVYLADASDTRFVLMANDGFDPRAVGSVHFARGAGLVGLVIEQQRPLALSNAQVHPRFRHVPEFGNRVHRGFLGVPVTLGQRGLGALVVRQLNDRTFGLGDERFMVAIADALARLVTAASPVVDPTRGDSPAHAAPSPWQGLQGAPGVALGIGVLQSPAADFDAVVEGRADDPQAEAQAFQQAVAAVRAELRLAGQRMGAGMPAEAHAMFAVYTELLDDDELFADTLDRIRAGASGASSLRRTITEHARVFEAMEDPYLRTRAEDLRGLGRRVLLRLQSGHDEPTLYPDRCVLVGEEVSIARIADVPVAQLAGIVCARGSPYSHAAILARTLGIPAVMGLGDVPLAPLAGRRLLVDGTRGRVEVDPPPDLVRAFEQASERQRASLNTLKALRDLPALTPDGTRVSLQANVGWSADLATALDCGAEGIGLFRTEFTFMVRDAFPSEDEQYRVYRDVLESFAPRPVTMRTLDIGGDKGLPYFPLQEDNAFLGWRGIRLTLDNPGIFLTQLRAMLRANAGLGNLKLLLPMISSAWEVDSVRDLLVRATDECHRAGQHTGAVSLGAMIEVPSAVYQMAALARRVDFFSIGTNDLTQYLLAVDRGNARVARHFDSLHPAVLRAMDFAIRGAVEADRPISVCGEMAGDPAAAVLLMGLGVETLSMAAPRIPGVKRALRTIGHQQARGLAASALAAEQPAEVRRMLDLALGEAGLNLTDPAPGTTDRSH